MNKKLIPIDGGGRNNEMANLIREAQREIPFRLQAIELSAQVTRHKYVCYIKEGFTPSQAMELIKAELGE